MKKVAIIGATGMLGSAVYSVLKKDCKLLITYRSKENLNFLYKKFGSGANVSPSHINIESFYEEYKNNPDNSKELRKINSFIDILSDQDMVINCTGVIKPFANSNPALTFFINGAFPHILNRRLGKRLIHVTTDCVFDGASGAPYTEESTKNPNDLYGLTKSIGEPDNSLVLRTSFIGREIGRKTSLLEWVLSNDGKKIFGYENHLWNGITTKEFGKVCHKIISDRPKFPEKGIYHIFSNAVSKYEMIRKISEKFKLNIDIQKKKVQPIDRRLGTVFSLNKKLMIENFDAMLKDL